MRSLRRFIIIAIILAYNFAAGIEAKPSFAIETAGSESGGQLLPPIPDKSVYTGLGPNQLDNRIVVLFKAESGIILRSGEIASTIGKDLSSLNTLLKSFPISKKRSRMSILWFASLRLLGAVPFIVP